MNVKVFVTTRKGNIINIKLSFNNGKYYLNIRDSMLMLPLKLHDLALAFKVENKSIFPYKFVNNNINNQFNLDYKDKVPSFSYFEGITSEQYKIYTDNFNNKHWSLRDETIKYCNQDCITLHQVIVSFNEFIYRAFNLNIYKYPTLPAYGSISICYLQM